MSQILVPESFMKGSMFMLNFTKIERGPDFFLLIWYGKTHICVQCVVAVQKGAWMLDHRWYTKLEHFHAFGNVLQQVISLYHIHLCMQYIISRLVVAQ